MSVAFLCVQFRNLLPSEDVLLFARSLWSDLQGCGSVAVTGDATLSVTLNESDLAPFKAEITIEGSAVRSSARDSDLLAAVQTAFARLALPHPSSALETVSVLCETATVRAPRVSI